MIHDFMSMIMMILFATPFVYMFVDVFVDVFKRAKVYIILITNKLF